MIRQFYDPILFTPMTTAIRRWFYRRIENHCLMSAQVEAQRAKEAQDNIAYFQKRAAIARSNQI